MSSVGGWSGLTSGQAAKNSPLAETGWNQSKDQSKLSRQNRRIGNKACYSGSKEA